MCHYCFSLCVVFWPQRKAPFAKMKRASCHALLSTVSPLAARRFLSGGAASPAPPNKQPVPPPQNNMNDDDDEAGPIISSRGAVEASYEQWASATGSCSLSDLTRGVKQAYSALGAVLDASIKVPKPELEKHMEQFLRKGGALAGSTAAVSSSAAASPSMEASPTSGLDAGASRTINIGSLSSGPTLDSLPLGSSFKYHLAVALKTESQGAFNPFQFAHPNDYVVDAKLQSFETFQSTKVTTVEKMTLHPDGSVVERKKKIQPPTAGFEQTPTPTPDPEGSSGAAPSDKPSQSTEQQVPVEVPIADATPPPPIVETSSSSKHASSNVSPSAQDAAGGDIVDQRVTISTTVPPTFIPRSAKAYVLITLSVVAPPRRFHAPFDWFYQRIRGHENDNERVALANVFAASTAFGMMKVFDHIVRLATGHPAEFVATRTANSMMRLPSDMTNKMMIKRKYVGLYLSKDGEWTISEVTNSAEEYDFEVPGGSGGSNAAPPAS
ncbi:Hypothetical protein, putative [Bodo saltans]|uniref:Uncharacterized protein n=1 Tax=Bodo saltans TaxID=75058 RepID=A0A0S4IP60_BODSA|nr:Hypothetical protein, putative [Bodo saltans]|eukprot:CUF00711.1 Hypothetical protein, putative [Bodo saltans]